jgi:hypothetical protein
MKKNIVLVFNGCGGIDQFGVADLLIFDIFKTVKHKKLFFQILNSIGVYETREQYDAIGCHWMTFWN